MKKVVTLLLCLVMTMSILPISAGAVLANDVDVPVNSAIAPRTVLYHPYTETIRYYNFDDIPQEIFRTKQYVVGSEVVTFSGVCALLKVEKVGGSWDATYSGDLTGYVT